MWSSLIYCDDQRVRNTRTPQPQGLLTLTLIQRNNLCVNLENIKVQSQIRFITGESIREFSSSSKDAKSIARFMGMVSVYRSQCGRPALRKKG